MPFHYSEIFGSPGKNRTYSVSLTAKCATVTPLGIIFGGPYGTRTRFFSLTRRSVTHILIVHMAGRLGFEPKAGRLELPVLAVDTNTLRARPRSVCLACANSSLAAGPMMTARYPPQFTSHHRRRVTYSPLCRCPTEPKPRPSSFILYLIVKEKATTLFVAARVFVFYY